MSQTGLRFQIVSRIHPQAVTIYNTFTFQTRYYKSKKFEDHTLPFPHNTCLLDYREVYIYIPSTYGHEHTDTKHKIQGQALILVESDTH